MPMEILTSVVHNKRLDTQVICCDNGSVEGDYIGYIGKNPQLYP